MPVQTSSSVKNLVNAFEKQPEPVKDTKPLPSRLALNVAPSAKVEPQASKFDCPGSKEERARLRAQTMLALEKTFSQGSSMPTGKTAMPKTVSPKKVLVKTVPEVPVSIAVEQPPVVKKPDEKALFDKAFAKMKELIASPLSGRGARQMAENMLKKPEVAAWFAACKDNQEVLKARTLELAKAFKEHGYLGRQHSPVTKALAVVMQMHASGELGGKVDDFAGGVLKEAKVAPEQILSLLNSYSKKAAYRGEQICADVLAGESISPKKVEKFLKAVRISQRFYSSVHAKPLNEVTLWGHRVGSLLLALARSRDDVEHGFFGRQALSARFGKEFAVCNRAFEDAQKKEDAKGMKDALHNMSNVVANYRTGLGIRKGMEQGKLESLGRMIAPATMRKRTASQIEADPKLGQACEQITKLTPVAAEAAVAELVKKHGSDKSKIALAAADQLNFRFVVDPKKDLLPHFQRVFRERESQNPASTFERLYCDALYVVLGQPKA